MMRSDPWISFHVAIILALLAASLVLATSAGTMTGGGSGFAVGVWNNFDYSRPPADWTTAARAHGGNGAVVDLVVAMAGEDGLTYLAFPHDFNSSTCSPDTVDRVEPYLEEFDASGLQVILSLQPGRMEVTPLIETVMKRYGRHPSVIGVNVDLEWKETGKPYHASNEERDGWLAALRGPEPPYRLFLTYFKDASHFPDDAENLVVLFDGEKAPQSSLLTQYRDLAKAYRQVGIYTGYPSSIPTTASNSRILEAAPNTRFILHVGDIFPDARDTRPVVIFEMDNVQVDWLEEVSVGLIDLHEERMVPVVCAVIPNGLDSSGAGGGYLPTLLGEITVENPDLFEVAQQGFTHNESEHLAGKSYEEQRAVIESGRTVLASVGVTPDTFVPPFRSTDEATVRAAADLGFSAIIGRPAGTSPGGPVVLDRVIPLTTTSGGRVVLKTPEALMSEIDGSNATVIVVSYPIFDFAPESGNSAEDLGGVMDALKESGNYRFTTAREYVGARRGVAATTTPGGGNQTAGRAGLLPIVAVTAVALALVLWQSSHRKGRRK